VKANSPGRPTELTKEVHARLIEAVSHVIIPSQVAAYARVPRTTLLEWLQRGEKDSSAHIDSIYAQFSSDFIQAQSEIVKETIAFLRSCPKNYQALIWLLERCFRKDFGSDSEEIKELIRNIEIIANAKKGGLDHETQGSEEGSQKV
jgi:hypothetical protein